MSCRSARCLGNKAKTYSDEIEHSLNALVSKIRRRLRLLLDINRLKHYSIFKKGYIMYPKPYVFFDFRYDNGNFRMNDERNIQKPEAVLPLIKEAAMINQDPILLENQRHSSNAMYFRIIIPIDYYNYDDSNLVKLVRL